MATEKTKKVAPVAATGLSGTSLIVVVTRYIWRSYIMYQILQKAKK
jgi:hypothetical protein